MQVNKINNQVFYVTDDILRIGFKDIEFLKNELKKNKNQRIRLCTHKGIEDKLHEMFIVHAKGIYVRPHKHVGKSESLYILDGLADVVIFDDRGDVIEVFKVGDYASGNSFYHRYPEYCYHMLIIRSEFLVFHEVTTGPFRKTNTVFASWSPEESDTVATKAFIRKISKSVDNWKK